jgi:hypothetical protein
VISNLVIAAIQNKNAIKADTNPEKTIGENGIILFSVN